MQPSKPFLITLSAMLASTAIAVALPAPAADGATTTSSLPLSTALTPAMVDYFGLDVASERPSIAALVHCQTIPACGSSDSSRVQFIDAAGRVIKEYQAGANTIIEYTRRQRFTPAAGVTEVRTLVRRVMTDEQHRIVVHGTDSISTLDAGSTGREPSTLVRVHRYSDVRFLVNDPAFPWPMTGLVVLQLSHAVGAAQHAAPRLSGHGAVSFDGTKYARILTSDGLTHRVDLVARRLETTMPDR
jgi:hypothetical protein